MRTCLTHTPATCAALLGLAVHYANTAINARRPALFVLAYECAWRAHGGAMALRDTETLLEATIILDAIGLARSSMGETL